MRVLSPFRLAMQPLYRVFFHDTIFAVIILNVYWIFKIEISSANRVALLI